MKLFNWRNSLKSTFTRKRKAPFCRDQRLRLCLEQLEDRTLLSTVNWLNPSGGNWDVGSNWVGGSVPGSGDDAVINTASAATITIQPGDSLAANSLVTGANDTLSIAGGSLTIGGSAASTSTLSGPLAMSGGTLTASGTGVSLTANGTTTATQASLFAQSGAELNLPQLTSYTDTNTTDFLTFEATGANSKLDLPLLSTLGTVALRIWAFQGGEVDVPDLTEIQSTSQTPQTLDVEAANSGSKIDLLGLTNFAAATFSAFSVTNQGTILDGNLTSLNGAAVTLDGTGIVSTNQWTSLTNGSLTIPGGVFASSNLTDIDGSSLMAQSGGSLTLSNLASYTDPSINDFLTFEATGSNSKLDLPLLNTFGQVDLRIWAFEGGGVDVPNLTSIQSGSQVSQTFDVEAANSGSKIDLSGLTNFSAARFSVLSVTAQATILDGLLTTLDNIGITLDGADTNVGNAWTSVTNSSFTITGGSYTLPSLTDASISNLAVSGGGSLNLPVLTMGSLALTNGQSLTIQGILVSVPAVGTAGATINVPQSQGLTLTLNNSGTLTGTTFDVGQGSMVVLAAGGTYQGGTSLNLGQAATAVLSGGTYTGGVTLDLGQEASADLTGGQTTTYGGTLTGSGTGTVEFSGGTFLPEVGGVTLNFPGSMFQWTGGSMELSVGNVTNLGTINLSGSGQTQIYADGTLDDYGTIIQTGTGDFGLHSDNVSPTTLKIEPAGQYLLESDAGITNLFNTNAIDNAGIIRKTGGTGTSTIGVNGTLINTGTIEADSGTLTLAPTSISQISGSTLTAGTWNALGGATLQFPSGTAITSNAGNLTLGGSGAQITGITGLATNSGSFTVTKGAGFTTAGDFSNSVSLTVGAGSTLGVTGNFTQTSAGTLNVQIGGTPASGLFGQLAVTKAAALAGALNVALVNGFTPSAGQQFNVVTFASATGTFGSFTGLGTSFTQALASTAEQLTALAAPADLVTSNVTAPTTATAGQQITVAWKVTDQTSVAATGSWQDSVYLSTTATITSTSILLGAVTHTGGLAANASYNGSFSGAVPAVAPGAYYVLVQADSLYQVPDANRANNIAAAPTGQLQVGVPALTLNTPLSDSFTAADQAHYYQLTVPSGGTLSIALASSAASGAVALYVGQGTLPTPYNFQDEAVVANQPNQTVAVPQVLTAGTYYILAHSVSGAAATAGFTLTATQGNAVSISAISSYSGGNAGNVTVEIDGTNFAPTATASLTLGATITATAIDFVNASQLFATFNLTGAAAGNYTLKVQQGAHSATAATTFQVVAVPSPAPLSVALVTPQFVRSGRTGTIVITYSNPTSNDMIAPLLDIESTNTSVFFSTPDDPNNYTQDAQVLAVAPSGPAGILRPGQSGQLTLTLLSNDTVNNDTIPVQVSQIETGQTIDWASQQSTLQPPSIPAAAWNVIFANLLATVGSTTDSYNVALARAATYLGGLGETIAEASDVGRLWSFLVSQADATYPTATLTSAVDASLSTPGSLSLAIERTFVSTIAGRYTQGIFGLGWTTSWQTSVSVDSSGNATINSAGSLSLFVAQANGTYLDAAGEYGTLTSSGGVLTFTDTAGTQYVFLPNGQLNYQQDTNGNRITLGYNALNQLVALTYANPADSSEPTEQLTLNYTNGLVTTVTDGTGNTWIYAYDAAGHLLSSRAPGSLTTSYGYDTGSDAETANALLTITNPDGAQQDFTYDPATGRLTGSSQSGGALTAQSSITYAYPGEAEVTATDSANNQTIVWFNDFGQPARVQNPRGAISTSLYDANGNLIGTTDAAGNTYQYAYDDNGDLTQIVNPLGQTVSMTFGQFSNLTSITDADGNTTSYNYGSTGNLLNIAYPDGTQQAFTYDPLGNLSETVLQNGDPISYQNNAEGLVTKQTFADGTSQTFTYDAHGNMLTADSFNAGGTLTGTTILTYNAANELLSIAYPGGLSLTFTYNAAGQRTKSVDQSGFTVNYSYDSLGRLSQLTDGSGNSIVQYTYNNLSQLTKKVNGNGTFTTYAYDADGNLISEINYAGGTTVNSSFTYTYNLLDEQTSVTDNAGNVTTYGYDATGQLIQIGLPGGQTINYVYNAAGDRTEVVNNGTATSYSSNSDNEITQVGSTVYTYAANGNLQTVTDSSGTTTYTYNDLNQLVSITNPDGSVQAFQYSPLGFMVGTSTTTGTTTSQTNYLFDPTGLGDVVASYDSSGSLIAHYTYGLGLVSQIGPSGTGYYDFNASGNTVGITGATGTYVNQYSYLPFGETTTIAAALPNPFTFAGQVGVTQIGNNLFYMRAREYTPATGQFISPDPSGLAGGDFNVRRYVGNNPAASTDPSGRGSDGGTVQTINSTVQSIETTLQTIQSTWQERLSNALAELSEEDQQAFQDGLSYWTEQAQLIKENTRPPTAQELELYAQEAAALGASIRAAALAAAAAAAASEAVLAVAAFGGVVIVGFGIGCGIGYLLTHLPKAPPRDYDKNPITDDDIDNLLSKDPNVLIGPASFGAQEFIATTGTLPYTIDFENDGSVAAQDVTVTEQLDPNLDWSTFQLGSFGFGPMKVTVPAGLTEYQTTVAYQNTDGTSLNVQVTLNFNVQTGLLTVTFTSLDPATGVAPVGVFDGFLPPDNSSGVGEGFVQYTVRPKASLTTGATINQQAAVVFDTNAAIDTATITNTIDAGPPTSSVAALPATETTPSFTVSWAGTDDTGGSGIASYTIYVSDNGGPFTPFLTATTQTSATFTGVIGNTYRFYSVATDNVGNVQATPAAAQATTTVTLPPEFVYNQTTETLVITLTAALPSFTFSQASMPNVTGTSTVYTFTLSGSSAPSVTETFTDAQLTAAPTSASVSVIGQGLAGTAILITNDTYLDQNGNIQETPERISLGSLTDDGVGTISKFIGNNPNSTQYTFLSLKNFPVSYAYAGRNDGTIQLYGTENTGKVGFVTAGYYSYIASAVTGVYAHFGEGTPEVVGTSAGNAADFAYHYTSSSPSTVSTITSVYTVNGITSSSMQGSQTNPEDGGAIDTFDNVALGFVLNTAVAYSGNSIAHINDSPMSDTYVGEATDPLGLGSIGGIAGFSYMFVGAFPNFNEFDVAYGFGTYYASSTMGGHDIDYPGEPANNVFSGSWIQSFS